MVSYTKLDVVYFQKQMERIDALVQKLDVRKSAIKDGRAIPDDGDLPIGTGRRMDACVLFIDICGFSSRKNNSPEEQDAVLWMLNLFFAEMIKIVEDYGGVVEKNTGDGLLAYFQGEGAGGVNAAQQALAAVLTMKVATHRAINPALEARGIPIVKFRASLDFGPITVAQVGARRRFSSIVAIGSTANLASKVMRFAGASEIVIGEMVAEILPANWRQYLIEVTEPCGWFLAIGTPSERPYKLYKYNGEWKVP